MNLVITLINILLSLKYYQEGQSKAVKVLLEFGADRTLADSKQRTGDWLDVL